MGVVRHHFLCESLCVCEVVLLAVDNDGRAPRPREATSVLDLLDQVGQILRFLRHLFVPPLQELEVFHLLLLVGLSTRTQM